MPSDLFDQFTSGLGALSAVRAVGRVQAIDGVAIWVRGMARQTALGDRLRLFRRGGGRIEGEAIGIRDGLVAFLPETAPDGVALEDRVAVLGPDRPRPGPGWIGRIVDPFGHPLDGSPMLPGPRPMALRAAPPAPASRRGLGPRLATGLNVLDTLLPLVRGQRIGLFAGSGVGKSRLLAHLARHLAADVVVLALVGERGRELRDFTEGALGPDGMARSVVVTATSDRSPLERRRCLHTAMTVAEHFRDAGQHVLFLADSVTRFAEAHREVAVAAGEIPALRGFPPSVTHEIMALCERAGPGAPGMGDITAVFTVLVAGSDMDEPVADILRGVLDGHVILDRRIAERGRYPAVDVLRSVSRSLPEAATQSEVDLLVQIRALLSAYENSEAMIRAGLYRRGSDPQLDRAIDVLPEVERFLAGTNSAGPEQAFDRLALILRRAPLRGGMAANARESAAL